MALSYDTDVEHLFPPALYWNTFLRAALEQVGLPLEAAGSTVLLSTDPHTVAALDAMNEPIKAAVRA